MLILVSVTFWYEYFLLDVQFWVLCTLQVAVIVYDDVANIGINVFVQIKCFFNNRLASPTVAFLFLNDRRIKRLLKFSLRAF
jgi:hypothetical protein